MKNIVKHITLLIQKLIFQVSRHGINIWSSLDNLIPPIEIARRELGKRLKPVVLKAARGSKILNTRLEPRTNTALHLVYCLNLKLTFRLYVFTCITFLFTNCQNEPKTPKLFQLLAPNQTNIHFENTIIETDSFNMYEFMNIYTGGGVAIGDINNDGLEDLFFTRWLVGPLHQCVWKWYFSRKTKFIIH